MSFSTLNIDFLTVGIAIAANIILGFVIFFGDSKSHTNRLFFIQTIVLSVWSSVNYLSYKITDPDYALLLVRSVLFFAVPNSITFLFLVYTFPDKTISAKPSLVKSVIVLTVITMLLTLTPFVFSGVKFVSGEAPQPIVAPGIILFMLVAVLSIPISLFILIKKFLKADKEGRAPLKILLIGVIIMFASIIVFDFILPTVFQNTRFIPLSAVFTFPFVAFTAYAITKHHLLNIKVITTEILTFVLAIVSLVEVVVAKDIFTIIFRSGVFVLILIFGILLIKSVIREVKLREELQVLNEKLKIADRMKSQFLSFASHQVKSPMSVVKDYAELIEDGSYGAVPDKVKETAEKIKTVANRLLELVSNLLDLRKLEEGKIEYQYERIDLNALIKNIVDELTNVAQQKHLELSAELPPGPLMITIDKEKIRQVIQNLIDNAIKYTEQGTIRVTLHATRDTIRIGVADTGMGIPQDLIPKLFEQFERGSDTAKKIQGTGLGLYIAKQFIEVHKGNIWAESPGPGKGSTFMIELPYGNTNSHN
ncbi:MAG: ATP-binding protein [Patescibacteria group bacterium]